MGLVMAGKQHVSYVFCASVLGVEVLCVFAEGVQVATFFLHLSACFGTILYLVPQPCLRYSLLSAAGPRLFVADQLCISNRLFLSPQPCQQHGA